MYEMHLIIVATVFWNVLGQRNTDFFGDPYNKYRDFPPRGPFQGQNKDEILLKKQLSNINPEVFQEIDENLEKYDKYDEFKVFMDQIKERTRQDPGRTLQDEIGEALQWARNLGKAATSKRGYPLQPWGRNSGWRFQDDNQPKPSLGMSDYWPEPAQQKKHAFLQPGPNNPQILTGRQAMDKALRTLESIDAIDNKSPMEKFPDVMKSLPKSLPTELLQEPVNPSSDNQDTNTENYLPKVDDYKSPIKWVSLDSNDTRDGLAKVTDPRTGRNQEIILNDTVFVPVIDYNIERLGLTTTTPHPVLTTDKRVLQAVQRNVDFKRVEERDWLAFETVLGGPNKSHPRQCDGDSCQSRCKTLACESVCTGDTCVSGCIGNYCNTFCKGPGCLSMCIGVSCTAKCEGLACDSRCRGNGCEAGCRKFSCTYARNGQSGLGGGTWGEHYPQYDDEKIKNSRYE